MGCNVGHELWMLSSQRQARRRGGRQFNTLDSPNSSLPLSSLISRIAAIGLAAHCLRLGSTPVDYLESNFTREATVSAPACPTLSHLERWPRGQTTMFNRERPFLQHRSLCDRAQYGNAHEVTQRRALQAHHLRLAHGCCAHRDILRLPALPLGR